MPQDLDLGCLPLLGTNPTCLLCCMGSPHHLLALSNLLLTSWTTLSHLHLSYSTQALAAELHTVMYIIILFFSFYVYGRDYHKDFKNAFL